MKRTGILHPALSQAIAGLGHKNELVVCDAGLPIPPGAERIDLAFAPGRPPFLEVLAAVLGEMEVEGAVLAAEINEVTPAGFRDEVVRRLEELPKVGAGGIEFVPHHAFKDTTSRARVIVRSGEFTPYANVILRSGVVF